MRSVCGLLAALEASGWVTASEAKQRVVLTDYCLELQLLQEVTRPGLTVRSQAAILARAMQHPKFRRLVKAHGDRNFSASEIDAALLHCRENRRTRSAGVLWIIALLVAAILATLLGAWKIVPGILAEIVGVVLWLFLAGLAGHHFGDPDLWIVLALPFAALADIWLVAATRDQPKESAELKPPPKHAPDWERNEGAARREELDRLRKAIEDRARR